MNTRNQVIKTTRKKGPKQVHWEEEMKLAFERLVRDYDQDLDTSNAIIKLIRYAINEHWLPGYIKRERPRSVNNALTNKLDNLDKMS